MSTLETYMHKQLKEVEQKLSDLLKNKLDYSEEDYKGLFNRYTGQRDILYQCLTAHDNTYDPKHQKLTKL